MKEDLTDEERSAQVRNTLFKALGVLVVVGLLIWIGTTIMVHALDLNQGSAPGPVGAQPDEPDKPLPTTALPVPGEKTDAPSDEPSDAASPDEGKKGRIELAISPVLGKPNERINLTGTYKGQDAMQLEVQRFDNGQWTNFGVQATVHVGTYETYIMTGRSGEMRFRMYDPKAQQGSNVILVTID